MAHFPSRGTDNVCKVAISLWVRVLKIQQAPDANTIQRCASASFCFVPCFVSGFISSFDFTSDRTGQTGSLWHCPMLFSRSRHHREHNFSLSFPFSFSFTVSVFLMPRCHQSLSAIFPAGARICTTEFRQFSSRRAFRLLSLLLLP